VLPDLKAYAMKPDRLWNYTRCEVHSIRGLRRGNALAAAVAQTASGVLALSAPQGTLRQGALAQACPDRKRRRTVIHVGAPRCVAGRSSATVTLRLLSRSRNVPTRTDTALSCLPAASARNPRGTWPMGDRRIWRKVQQRHVKTCSVMAARNLSACLRWPRRAPACSSLASLSPRKLDEPGDRFALSVNFIHL
jgi:hypothetical protein